MTLEAFKLEKLSVKGKKNGYSECSSFTLCLPINIHKEDVLFSSTLCKVWTLQIVKKLYYSLYPLSLACSNFLAVKQLKKEETELYACTRH